MWVMSSEAYLKEEIRNFENDLKDFDKCTKSKAPAPLLSRYRPELDGKPLLLEERATHFLSLRGFWVGLVSWDGSIQGVKYQFCWLLFWQCPAPAPLLSRYRPELDGKPLLLEERAMHFLSLIGILGWACELGWINTRCEVSILLASFLAMPREGHLAAVMPMFCLVKDAPDLYLCTNPVLAYE
jgi:hypothetical protein